MGQQLFVHVGLTKTGTSYLQVRLRAALDELERQGVTLVPRDQFDAHLLSLVVREAYDPAVDALRGEDALERLPEQLAATSAERVLISEEMLAGAKRGQIKAFGEAIGDRHTHIVVTLRDIARSLPSVWQQLVKAGRTLSFEEYLDTVIQGPAAGGGVFWRGHDVLGVLGRWEALAPPERCHVVLVPPSGAPREQLLERFCSVLGVDAGQLPPPPPLRTNQVNESLGLVQAEVLRQVNELLPEAARRRDVHRQVVKKPFTFGVLAAQQGTPIRLPRRYEAWCREHTEDLLAALEQGGYQVVGDPADLLPAAGAFTDEPVVVDPAEVAEVAVRAIAAMLDERIEDFVTAKDQVRGRRRRRRAAKQA